MDTKAIREALELAEKHSIFMHTDGVSNEWLRQLLDEVDSLQYKYDKYRETAVERVRWLEQESERLRETISAYVTSTVTLNKIMEEIKADKAAAVDALHDAESMISALESDLEMANGRLEAKSERNIIMKEALYEILSLAKNTALIDNLAATTFKKLIIGTVRTTLERLEGGYPPMPTGTERISHEEAKVFMDELEGGEKE